MCVFAAFHRVSALVFGFWFLILAISSIFSSGNRFAGRHQERAADRQAELSVLSTDPNAVVGLIVVDRRDGVYRYFQAVPSSVSVFGKLYRFSVFSRVAQFRRRDGVAYSGLRLPIYGLVSGGALFREYCGVFLFRVTQLRVHDARAEGQRVPRDLAPSISD